MFGNFWGRAEQSVENEFILVSYLMPLYLVSNAQPIFEIFFFLTKVNIY